MSATRGIVFGACILAVGMCGCGKKSAPPAAKGGGAASQPAGGNTAVPRVKLSLPPVETAALNADYVKQAQALINGGIRYLLAQRNPDGGWSIGGHMKPAITALVLKCLLQHPDFDRTTPIARKALSLLVSYQQPDGAIFEPKEGSPAYSTAIAIMALASADDPRYGGAIRRATDYLKGIQIQPGQESPDGTPVEPNSPRVGGVGYGKDGEPNLSVLQFVVEAWHEAGMKPDDEAMKRAVNFLSRVQNRSESNFLDWARRGANDGGFVYDLKTSKAGPDVGGGLRSYGTMTYAGFKSMLYAGVARDDPRVQAAYQWIRRYWRLDSNPNMPQAHSKEGLYYYYHVFAKALRAWGQDEIPDLRKPIKHNWRRELIDALAERVRPDGSWVNDEAKRWEEGNAVLATCYSVLALEEALKK
ncbi:MAG: terpene cyclase/mutase family protein [Planctomycetes bacterium]|nr:terpene cyclase/mutase family protein [Planctomycetota bacterium]